MERYTIRSWWRGVNGRIGLIVADAEGVTYLFWGDVLQIRCNGPAASDRLDGLVARRATRLPALATGSYTLHELRYLVPCAGSTVLH